MAQANSSFGRRHWFDWLDRRTAQYLPELPNEHLDAPRVAVWLVGATFSVLAWVGVALFGALLLLHAFRPADAVRIDRIMISVPAALFEPATVSGAQAALADFDASFQGQPVPLRAAATPPTGDSHPTR